MNSENKKQSTLFLERTVSKYIASTGDFKVEIETYEGQERVSLFEYLSYDWKTWVAYIEDTGEENDEPFLYLNRHLFSNLQKEEIQKAFSSFKEENLSFTPAYPL